jgi:hypothetical protein
MMLRNIAPVLLALVISTVACDSDTRPAVTAGVDACSHCQMVIDRVKQASGFVADGAFRPFDSPACLLAEYEVARKAGRRPVEVYFADFETGAFRRADSTSFLVTPHIPTVMNAGIVCFGDEMRAMQRKTRSDEEILDWDGLRLGKGTPDRVVRVRVGESAIEPDRIPVNLGDLVELHLLGDGESMELAVRGYDEIGRIAVPGKGDPVKVRFWAARPGAGFPVIDTRTGATLGRLAVAGAHTLDEEARTP